MAALRPVAASACCKAAAPAIATMSAKRGGRLPSRPACSRLSSPRGNAAVARPACWQRRQWRGGAAAAGSRGPPPGESEPPTPGGPYDAAADAKPTAKSSAGPPQEPLKLQPLFPADQCTPAGATPQQRAQRTSPSPRRRQPSGAAAGDGSGRRLASEEQVVALLQEAVVGPIRADVAAVAAACGRLEEAQQVHAAALAEAQELLRTLEGRAAVAASAVAAVAADSTAPATDINPQLAPGEATGAKASPVQPPAGEQQHCEQTPPPTAEVSPVPSGSAARADSSSGRGSSGGSTRRGALLSAAVAVGAAAGVAAYNLQLGSVPAPPPASLPATQQDATGGALDRSGARGGGGDGADGAAMNGGSSATAAGRSSTDPLRSQGSTPNYCKRLVTLREPVNDKELSLLELLDAPVAQPGAVKQLLMLGNVDANICTGDRKGIPALALALRWDHLELVEVMLEAGATACAADLDGYTLMHYARSGAAVRLLVRRGAFVNAKAENWMTPLHVAAREGWVDAAQALLDAGADVSGRTLLEQRTPLHVAAVNGQFQIVRQLLAAGAAVDAAASRRETALHRAAAAGHTGVCRLLLTAGADPAVKNTSELTPADVAPTSKLRNLLRPRT